MLARILRACTALIVVTAAYFLYALTVARLIEPAAASAPANVPGALAAADKSRLEPLRAFFQADAWELQNPIIIENPQFKLLLGEYESLSDGRVKLTPCTMMFFPDGQDADSGGRVLIMQAQEGALLQFDQEADLSRAKIGKLQRGSLVGEVTIRGNLSGNVAAGGNAAAVGNAAAAGGGGGGANDELFITTRGVELQPDSISTQNEVQFRMGRNHGSGRDLQIKIDTGTKPNATGKKTTPSLAIESLRLLKDVHLYLELDSSGLLPGKRGAANSSAAVRQPASAPPPPMEVRCKGAFRFDMARLQATFEDQVDVMRLNREGPSDQLNAELLTIQFEKTAKDAADADKGKSMATQPQQQFRVTKLVARGNPVSVSSPAVSGSARGEHLQFEVAERRLILDGQMGVTLAYESSRIQAGSVRYEAVEGSTLGRVWAGGPGQFQTTLPGKQLERLIASWQEVLQVQPHDGRQVLSLIGGAQVQYGETGSMLGDELWLWLDENKAPTAPRVKPPDGDNPAANTLAKFTPHLMLARGNVQVSSPQLSGKTNQLEAWFEPTAAAANSTAATRPADKPARDDTKPTSHFQFESDVVQLRFGLPPDGSPSLMDAGMTGGVRLAEQKPAGNTETPLLITGDQLQLRSADTDRAVVTINGAPAHAAARNFAVTAPAIQLDKKANRVEINGAGSMRVPVDRDLQGGKLAQPRPLDVAWQGQMSFDGQTIRFDRNVVARTDQQQLQTNLLTIQLTRRVNLSEPVDQNALEVARIDCSGGVAVTATTIEDGRRTSFDRFQVPNLSIDQTTGRIQADGAGWLSSIREGSATSGGGPFSPAQPATQPAPAAAAGQPANRQLTYIKVTFQRGINGNLNQREIVFSDQVRCIYGPVSDWNAELNLDKPDGPQGQEVMLKSRQLAVRQMGTSHERWTELDAQGNITVEGALFTAEGERMTYTTGKDLMVLSGGGQTDARISHQKTVGGPVNQTAAKRFLYWQKTGRVQIEGIGFGTGTIEPRNR